MNVIVGVADMKLDKGPGKTLVTYALGSCLGVCIYDPLTKVGGLLHYMLPTAKSSPDKAQLKPYMFGDTGIPALFKEAYAVGAEKKRLQVKLIGGANVLDSAEVFNIGKRNYQVARKLFFRNNIMVEAELVGGVDHRTVKLDLATGKAEIKIKGGEVVTL